jgi:Ca2+-binding RTX toxin-like protein
LAIYTRSNIAIPASTADFAWGSVDQWSIDGSPTSTVVVLLNLDGTKTRLTGTGFTFDGSNVPTAGVLTKIERLSSDGLAIYQTLSSIPPSFSLVTFYNTIGGRFDLAVLSGNDTLNGGNLRDVLESSIGVDTINGGGGNDLIYSVGADGAIDGGTGLDEAVIDRSGGFTAFVLNFSNPVAVVAIGDGTTIRNVEAISFIAGGGSDRITASNDARGRTYNSVYGGSFDDILTASANGATLYGELGIDTLNGGNGIDLLVGGHGNDILNGGGGNDLLYGDYGPSGDNGDAGGDIINGGAGDDLLHAGYGTGFDRLAGGLGNDTYVIITDANYTFTEAAGQGTDRIKTAVNFELFNQSVSIEIIETLNVAGTGSISLTGNGIANTILGNNGVNVLSGGLGGDTLRGYGGNDTLYGWDLFNDHDTGADVLDGGAGSDRLVGGGGNDIYITDGLDTLVESVNAGTDTVQSSVISLNLASFANIENVGLLGTLALNGTGNNGNNVLTGNSGVNILSALGGNDTLAGGLGNDRLAGGVGNDTFLFNAAPNTVTNRDVITDFNVVADTIRLENTGAGLFNALAAGALNTQAFIKGAGFIKGKDANDRIVYNTATGDLYYDRDGSGAAVAIKFATLTNKAALTHADFFIV